ncbi:hypothetical protein HELRODRAFT_172650 [Helobdella robusta]|uniref:Uncharacterized protein n=1 Tax=Helobdella robusta TaxID=6412 RepID=T1F5Q3_HELRO|nr:hypothetical protein HELRODRAFT_172650 [Helobdella robusta]ESO04293.1 hypothetical protein HELRODRAFT_172650 [Helobdella robusta]
MGYARAISSNNKKYVKMVMKRELNIDIPVDSKLYEGCVYGKIHQWKFGTRPSKNNPGYGLSQGINFFLIGTACFQTRKREKKQHLTNNVAHIEIKEEAGNITGSGRAN